MVRDKKYNSFIFILKALSIVSVVCAHSTPMVENSSRAEGVISHVFGYVGTMGVPVFYILSGYLFVGNTKTFWEFWKRKLVSIVIPWLIFTVLPWGWTFLRHRSVDGVDLLHAVIGYNNPMYYMSMLILMYLFFWIVKTDVGLYIVTVISVVSIVLTGWGVIADAHGVVFVNSYLNPFNWMCYFSFGMIARRKNLIDRIRGIEIRKKWLVFVGSLVAIGLYAWSCNSLDFEMTYFSKLAIIGVPLNTVSMVLLASILEDLFDEKAICYKVFRKMGGYSFTIYLAHQLLIGFVVSITNKLGNMLLIVIRPLITVFVIIAIIELIMFITKRNRVISVLLGLR